MDSAKKLDKFFYCLWSEEERNAAKETYTENNASSFADAIVGIEPIT